MALEILTKEFCTSQCSPRCCVLQFDPSGFHIVHDVVIYLSSEHGWNEGQTCEKKFCNLSTVSKDGLAASVTLYVQWPIETQIECYIDSTDERSITYAIKEISQAVGYVLAKRKSSLKLKFHCSHPDCQSEDIHFASPDEFEKGFLVCEKKKRKYRCCDRFCLLLANTHTLEDCVGKEVESSVIS